MLGLAKLTATLALPFVGPEYTVLGTQYTVQGAIHGTQCMVHSTHCYVQFCKYNLLNKVHNAARCLVRHHRSVTQTYG